MAKLVHRGSVTIEFERDEIEAIARLIGGTSAAEREEIVSGTWSKRLADAVSSAYAHLLYQFDPEN